MSRAQDKRNIETWEKMPPSSKVLNALGVCDNETIEYLAEMTDLSPPVVKAALNTLEQRGFVEADAERCRWSRKKRVG